MEHHHQTSENSQTEYLKFIGIIVAIFVGSIIAHQATNGSGVEDWMRMFMGIFLFTFAVFKFAGYEMFVEMFSGYDLIAKKSKAYSYMYPFIELLLASLFLFNIYPIGRNIAVIIIMGIGAVGVYQEIKYKRHSFYCACLGNIIKLPLSTVSLVENLAMVIMASVMLLI